MKTPVSWSPRRVLVPIVAVATIGVVVWGCSRNPVSTDTLDISSETTTLETAAQIVLPEDNEAVQAVMAVQNRHTDEIMRIPGVVGVGTSADENGVPVIRVFTERKLPPGLLKQDLEGVRVVEEVSGRIVAFKGGPGGGGYTALQTPPIQLGTSGGPALDIANGYCCGGTLGSLVRIGTTQYILSNSHVFAGDVVSGGNGRVSSIGDDVTQPGLIDVGCNAANANAVADVSTLSTLYPPGSTPNVDASLAQVRSGMVRTDGSILGIGTISSSTVAASIGQAVKKSGRTTGTTRATVSTLNVTVNVGYSTECAGSSFTKTFTGQIIVSQRGSRFLNSGDSGSLMVEDVTTNPRAVGLLYAGSSTSAVANPINSVLSHFGASMVGN